MKNTEQQGNQSGKAQIPGKYRWLGGLLTACLLLGAVSSTSAHSTTGNAAKVKGGNNGAMTAHFTAEYYNGAGGFFTAAGERIAKTAPKAFTKDSETILMSDISTFPAGTYTLTTTTIYGFPLGMFTLNGQTYYWSSDFDGQYAVSGTIVVTDNGDGTGTLNAVLYY